MSKAQNGKQAQLNLAERLQGMQWRNRILVLCAPDANHGELVRQIHLLRAEQAGMDERNLVQLTLVESELDAETKKYLNREWEVEPGAFTVLLIGKDGGVKYRATKATAPRDIFATIDAMPMRQSEMRTAKQK